MAIELEIEFKNLLTETEYLNLLHHFKVTKETIKEQTNIYFDTLHHTLREKNCALRVRIKNQKIEMTLKEQTNKGIIETTDPFTKDQLERLLSTNQIEQGDVLQALNRLGCENKLFEIATLTTYRAELRYGRHLIALDKSIYYNHVDFEIELETENYQEGKNSFYSLLDEFNIPVRKAEHKISRALQYKKQ